MNTFSIVLFGLNHLLWQSSLFIDYLGTLYETSNQCSFIPDHPLEITGVLSSLNLLRFMLLYVASERG